MKFLMFSRKKKCIRNLEVVTAYLGKSNSVLDYAKNNDIQTHTWPLAIETKKFDLGVVVSFGHLIPTKIIESFPL